MYADLTPETQSRVDVQFRTFKIFGLIPVTAPPSARGKLDTTYLDEALRVGRGDKGWDCPFQIVVEGPLVSVEREM